MEHALLGNFSTRSSLEEISVRLASGPTEMPARNGASRVQSLPILTLPRKNVVANERKLVLRLI